MMAAMETPSSDAQYNKDKQESTLSDLVTRAEAAYIQKNRSAKKQAISQIVSAINHGEPFTQLTIELQRCSPKILEAITRRLARSRRFFSCKNAMIQQKECLAALSPLRQSNENYRAVYKEDGHVVLFNRNDENLIKKIPLPAAPIDYAMSLKKSAIAIIYSKSVLHLDHDQDKRASFATLLDIYRIALSPEGSVCAALDQTKRLLYWMQPSVPMQKMLVFSCACTAFALSRKGKRCALGTNSGVIVIHTMAPAKDISWAAHPKEISALLFTPHCHHLASAGIGCSTIRIWQPRTGELLTSISSEPTITTLSFHPKANTLMAESAKGISTYPLPPLRAALRNAHLDHEQLLLLIHCNRIIRTGGVCDLTRSDRAIVYQVYSSLPTAIQEALQHYWYPNILLPQKNTAHSQ